MLTRDVSSVVQNWNNGGAFKWSFGRDADLTGFVDPAHGSEWRGMFVAVEIDVKWDGGASGQRLLNFSSAASGDPAAVTSRTQVMCPVGILPKMFGAVPLRRCPASVYPLL